MTAVIIPHPAASRHAFRAQVCRLVDRLIGLLDEIDGDPDLESGGDDEPSLAFQEARSWESQDNVIRLSPIGGEHFTDLEEVCEDEGAENDGREPDPSDAGIGETGEGPQ